LIHFYKRMSGRALAISASARGMAEDSSSSSRMRKTTKTMVMRTDADGNVTTTSDVQVSGSGSSESAAFRRYEEQIRVLQEDLDSEHTMRRRVEQEKQSFQMQIISLSERLTEAESGSESQLDINRKREAEMSKLRKLLEDVHTESEVQIHQLRTKHQTSMMELQEMIEKISREKEKVSKEKNVMKTEISELYAQIEILQSEKISIKKVVERLEITVNEYHIKIGDLNRTVQDMTSSKAKLQMESQESSKRLNELKLAIEHAGMDKNKFASQLDDLRRAADAEAKGRTQAETKITSLERTIKSMMAEKEELLVIKVQLESYVEKWKAENNDWKKKYENEARLRVEEVDALKKKFTVEVNGLHDALNNLEQKLKAAENQKQKLGQENSVLIKEVEHCQVVIREITERLRTTEKSCMELGTKLKEMTNLYERADRDNKARAQEVVKMGNDMDRLKMSNETLTMAKGKLEDELKSYKMEFEGLKKRYAEFERDNRKLAHEREELARAYKDANDGKTKALDRVAQLEKELANLRRDAEKGLGAARDEFESIKKKLIVEIDTLTRRLCETDSRLKNEVEVIKKKMSITITELEMSLDASNKSCSQLQNTTKMQANKIMELTGAYDDVNKKLAGSLQQYDITFKQLRQIEQEFKGLRANNESSIKVIKEYESKLTILTTRVNELTTINNNLTQSRGKLEKELSIVSREYDDITKELKMADDRANKAGNDAQHFESLLREEQTKMVNLVNAKKSLENEVRTLSVRIEEIESTAMVSSKRTIQKMEIRITELETMIDSEKKSHSISVTELHKREQSIKQLLLQSEEDRKNIIILQESLDKLNEKIKMYKRQLDEQESISNSNIMRVKKFQRELESAESRAEEAESTLNQFRSRERVFAAASARSEKTQDIQESEVIVKKTINKVNVSGGMSGAMTSSISRSAQEESNSSSALQSSYARAGSVAYSRAGSVARAGSTYRASSMARAGSMSRAGSMLRY
jgi:chromosome segregation ATPase